MDPHAGELAKALLCVGMYGNLDGTAANRSERTALIATAEKRGLLVWSRGRKCYQLTRAGYRVAASCDPQCTLSFRRRLSPQAVVVTGVALLAAGSVAIGVANMTAQYGGREPKPSNVAKLATVPSVPEPPLLALSNEPDSQPMTTLPPDNTLAATEEERRRVSDTPSTPRAQKDQKVASTHRHKPRKATHERRRDMGTGYASTGYAHFQSRGRDSLNPGAP
jgi:hypothetical protein